MKKFLMLGLLLPLVGCGDLGTLEKVGTIVRLQQHEFFCKTWEGQIIRGGFNAASGVMGAPYDFTIEDESLVQKVKDVMESQTEVKIRTHKEMNSFCRSDSESHFLTSIEPLHPTLQPVPTESAAEIRRIHQEEIERKIKELEAELGK